MIGEIIFHSTSERRLKHRHPQQKYTPNSTQQSNKMLLKQKAIDSTNDILISISQIPELTDKQAQG